MIEVDEQFNIPTAFVIFGATGDLARKKLFPALCRLHSGGYLPGDFKIFGFSRRDITDSEFRDFIKDSILEEDSDLKAKDVDELLEKSVYIQGLFGEFQDYDKIIEKLDDYGEEVGEKMNRLFYLAAPPGFYETIFDSLARCGLMDPCSDEEGWARVLVEKPFGKTEKSAKKLDKLLSELFEEPQVFRIDHYLSKEAILNILAFRFSNTLFDNSWNKDGIEKVEVKMLEDFGVEDRTTFYEGVGALRDVGQNHLLQTMAVVGMDNPGELTPEAIRRARADFFDNLELIEESEMKDRVVLGQHEGYRNLEGVDSDSRTETYFKIKAFVDSDRWEGIPFYLESGKEMDETLTKINIHFKKCENCLCSSTCDGHRNVLTFEIKPEEVIRAKFWAKKPGMSMELEPRFLSFSEKDGTDSIGAYERLIYQAVIGDQTLFVSSEEEMLTWEFIMNILKNKDDLELIEYEKGSESVGEEF